MIANQQVKEECSENSEMEAILAQVKFTIQNALESVKQEVEQIPSNRDKFVIALQSTLEKCVQIICSRSKEIECAIKDFSNNDPRTKDAPKIQLFEEEIENKVRGVLNNYINDSYIRPTVTAKDLDQRVSRSSNGTQLQQPCGIKCPAQANVEAVTHFEIMKKLRLHCEANLAKKVVGAAAGDDPSAFIDQAQTSNGSEQYWRPFI